MVAMHTTDACAMVGSDDKAVLCTVGPSGSGGKSVQWSYNAANTTMEQRKGTTQVRVEGCDAPEPARTIHRTCRWQACIEQGVPIAATNEETVRKTTERRQDSKGPNEFDLRRPLS